MAKIYSAPFAAPEVNFAKFHEYDAKWKAYETELRDWCIKRNPSEYVGEIVSFPVADGSALYMVAAMKPLELIHLDYLDGYQFQYDNRLKASDIKDKIESTKALEKYFPSTPR